MIQLTQANQLIANTQQQNQQAMIDTQKQQVDAFNALVDATQQQKLMHYLLPTPCLMLKIRKSSPSGWAGSTPCVHQQEET